MGWRVELRTMEVQLTDFENAAFTVFTALLCRVLLSFDLNLYIPLSLVDANFQRARMRQAASKQLFWFRRHVVPLEATASSAVGSAARPSAGEAASVAAEMSLADILLGTGDATGFPGLIPLIFTYLDAIKCDAATRELVDQ